MPLTNIVDKDGRVTQKTLPEGEVIRAAIKELLLAHDGLYREVFKGTTAKPQWDIAAKNARRVYESMLKECRLPTLTIEDEFLKP